MAVTAPAPLDTLGLAEAVHGLADQLERATADLAGGIGALPDHEDVQNVLFLAAGEGLLAARAVVAVAAPESAVPLVAVHGDELPGFVSEGTLIIAVGDRDEIVEMATEAVHAGASLLAISRGGALSDLASGIAAPVVSPDVDDRYALGALVAPIAVALAEVGLYATAHADIGAAVVQLRARRAAAGTAADGTDTLVRRIGGTFPLVYGSGAIGDVAAARWKWACNTAAKIPAFANSVGDLAFGEIAGWGQHGDITRQVLTLVELRHEFEHPSGEARFSSISDQMAEIVASWHEVMAEGEGALAQLLDLCYVGDVVALKIAARSGVDPGPVPAVDQMLA